MKKVLVACEYSGIVRDAFTKVGWDATSCDLLPSEKEGKHYQGDVFDIIDRDWNLLIAFPPCTDLCVSGARWFKEKIASGAQQKSIEFFLKFTRTKIPRVCIENPIGIMSTKYEKPTQIIQPWMFGHGETKATCLWLKNLPKLIPTNIVKGRNARVHKMAPGPDRWRERSRTYFGVAEGMANQWKNV